MRFTEFVGDWQKKHLRDALSNKSVKYNPETSNKALKCIELEHLATGTGQLLGYCNASESGSIKNRFNKGDVLFGKLRPYLRKYLLAPFDGVCSSEIWVIIGKDALNEYIYWLIQTEKFIGLSNQSSGSKMPRADWDVISSSVFHFPSIPEQQKIASFFSAIDQKITQLKLKKNLLEQYKKGVMEKIFSQEIRFKDDNGQEFLMWEKAKFNQIYSFKVTNSFSRDNLNYEEGDVKNIHYGDIHTKFNTLFDINKEEVPFINPDISIKRISSDNYCKTSDIVFADASEDLADVGKSIELVNLNDEKVLAGLHTILARPDITKIASGFGGYLMKSIDVRKQIMKIAQGSKITSISSTRLCDIELNIPCLPEQSRIANFLSAIDKKISQTQTQIEKAEVWKKGLMQQMFV